MTDTRRLVLLAIAVVAAIVLVCWFGLGEHDAHSLLRAVLRAL